MMPRNARPLRNAKFTDREVIEIRARAQEEGFDVRAEADRYQVSPETIRKICRFDTFRWVGQGVTAVPLREVAPPPAGIARTDQEAQDSAKRMWDRFSGKKDAAETGSVDEILSVWSAGGRELAMKKAGVKTDSLVEEIAAAPEKGRELGSLVEEVKEEGGNFLDE